jgi:hypothetical protein
MEVKAETHILKNLFGFLQYNTIIVILDALSIIHMCHTSI